MKSLKKLAGENLQTMCYGHFKSKDWEFDDHQIVLCRPIKMGKIGWKHRELIKDLPSHQIVPEKTKEQMIAKRLKLCLPLML